MKRPSIGPFARAKCCEAGNHPGKTFTGRGRRMDGPVRAMDKALFLKADKPLPPARSAARNIPSVAGQRVAFAE